MSDATPAAATGTTHLGSDAPADAPASAPVAAPAAAPVAAPAAAPAADAPKPDATDPAAEADKPADGKDADGKDAKPAGAPEKYEFKAPEGVSLDAERVGKFTEWAKANNLTQEAAQAAFDMATDLQKANAETLTAAIEAQAEKWGVDSKADKEFGGEKFDENLAVAKRALDQFGTPELKSLLAASKLGNHPEVLRFFVRAGKAISEDGFVPGRTGNASGQSVAQRLFPNMNP